VYTIVAYTDKKGKSPFEQWLLDLDLETRRRVDKRIDRLSFGNFGDVKPVGEGVHELRLTFGAGYRIYFANVGNRIILLLTGGDKSSQKRDIENAKTLFNEYKDRKKDS
jgi:putative addiction module killer protein